MSGRLFFLSCVLVTAALTKRITQLPGYGPVTENWFSGYKKVTSQNGKSGSLFYWFLEGPPRSPVVVWFNGGPGCSSLIGLFAELGPLIIQEDYTLVRNNNSWNQMAHMLFIDQPIGTGYSFADGKEHFTENQVEIVDHLHSLLKQFFNEYPEYDTDLYIAGESYAGKYIPNLAERIIKVGPVGKGKLKGLIIGDGLVDPIIQRTMKHEQAYWAGLVGINQRKQLQLLQGQCIRHIQLGGTNQLDGPCDELKSLMILYSGIINVYDLRRFDPSTNKTRIEVYLNKPEVREAIHVTEFGTKNRYTTCSKNVVYMHLKYDILFSVKNLIPFLIKHTRVLFYNGNFDLQDGPVGTEQFLYTLNITDFNNARRDLWFDGDHVAGYSQTAGNLTFVTVHGAGHFVPTDQPHSSIDLLRRFINKQPYCENTSIPITHSSLTPADFDKYLEQDKNNKTLLPCNIQEVGCKLICKNGNCVDGVCKCRENFAGEDCKTLITNLQRTSRSLLRPQDWRYYRFGKKGERNIMLDIKYENSTDMVQNHFVGHGFGTDSPTQLCVYIAKSLPTHLYFTHVACGEGLFSLPVKGRGIIGVFNGERYSVKLLMKSEFVSQRIAGYTFHVAFNARFFGVAGTAASILFLLVFGWVVVISTGKVKEE